MSTEDKRGRTFKLMQCVLDVDESKAIKNMEKYLANWGQADGVFERYGLVKKATQSATTINTALMHPTANDASFELLYIHERTVAFEKDGLAAKQVVDTPKVELCLCQEC